MIGNGFIMRNLWGNYYDNPEMDKNMYGGRRPDSFGDCRGLPNALR
jgi:hypothetical protein